MLPDILFPHHAVDTRNPIFRRLWGHLRLINSEKRLLRCNQLLLGALPTLLFAWWLIERFHVNFAPLSPEITYRLINTTLVFALCVMLALSLYSIPRVLGTYHTQFTTGYWDALRLTPQYNSAILMSHDAIAQLRLWPFTALEVGLRFGILLLFIANELDAWYYTSPQTFWNTTLLNPFFWFLAAIIICMGILFALEPIIRARVIITLHLLVAIRIRSAPLAVLTGFTTLLLIHASQVVLILVIWLMSVDFARQNPNYFTVLFCLVPLVLIASLLFSLFFAWLRKFTLNLAYTAAFPD